MYIHASDNSTFAAKIIAMIIPLKRDGDLEEWAIIELQGDLKFDSPGIKTQYVGDIHFTKSGTPVFIIGIHILHGKEVALPKPIAVLQKEQNISKDDEMLNSSEIKTEYTVKAIVKKKLVFRSRPKPIITNVPKSN